MSDIKPRVRVPATAQKGEIIEIKTLVNHPMETGMGKNAQGQPIPRKIINKFSCTLNDREVFRADLYPAISANPFIVFYVRVAETSRLQFFWTDDDGAIFTEHREITVA